MITSLPIWYWATGGPKLARTAGTARPPPPGAAGLTAAMTKVASWRAGWEPGGGGTPRVGGGRGGGRRGPGAGGAPGGRAGAGAGPGGLVSPPGPAPPRVTGAGAPCQ